MRTIYGNPERFQNTYFKEFPGYYVTGDGEIPPKICFQFQTVLKTHVLAWRSASLPPGLLLLGCRRDKDGYYWITGRIDDMLNVSGKGRLV